jgi:UDP-N-acetyl-D-mannosaminuronate dehydrogenase
MIPPNPAVKTIVTMETHVTAAAVDITCVNNALHMTYIVSTVERKDTLQGHHCAVPTVPTDAVDPKEPDLVVQGTISVTIDMCIAQGMSIAQGSTTHMDTMTVLPLMMIS